MASNVTTTTAADSPVSRKRPAEDEAPKAEELQPEGESVVSAPAGADASAENGADDDGEQQPAKRARKEEDEDGDDDEKKEEEAEETKETEAEENKKKEQKAEESGGSGKLAFLGPTGEGFSSFSSFAAGPLSFSSVSSGAADAGAAPLSFNLGAAAGSTPGPFSIDFSSPTPFGSLFGGDGGKDAAATPSLTSTGFTLFSSSSPSTSSDFAFSLSSSSSSLLFSSGAESSSTSVAEKVEVVTGEENEERVHSVRAKLLKLEPESQAWKERGSGQLHLNVAKDRSYARLVMRAEGALRLILNTALFPHTITKRVQEKGVQVSAVEEGKPVLYLLRASRRDEAEELFAAINRHKELGGGSSATSL